MGFFTRLFKNKANPDNLQLLKLLGIYSTTHAQEDYYNVYHELMNGNSFLIFPTKNNRYTKGDEWTTLEKGSTLKLASVVNLDGLKVLGAFTDEEAMLTWTKEASEYTAMTAQTVMKFCQDNGIDRVVINTGLPNMFVLERNRENIKKHVLKEDTTVQMGTPKRPISGLLLSRLMDNFKKDITIAEVYQYGQSIGGEFSIVLGFKLTVNSENAQKAAIFAVQNALQTDTLDQPLDLYFIETEDVYERIKRINNSLLYKQEVS